MLHEMQQQYEQAACRRPKDLLREGKTKAKHLFMKSAKSISSSSSSVKIGHKCEQ